MIGVAPLPEPSKAAEAKKLIPELQKIVESDLMKAGYYLEKGVKLAIMAEDNKKAEMLATFFVEIESLVDRFQRQTRRLVD